MAHDRFVMTWNAAAAVTEVEPTFAEAGPALTRVADPSPTRKKKARWASSPPARRPRNLSAATRSSSTE
jgi:hypothetical protein